MPPVAEQAWTRAILPVSVLLYGSSLCFPAFEARGATGPGWMALLVGWLGVPTSPYDWPWLANPLIVVAWFSRYKRRRGPVRIASWLAGPCALSFLLWGRVVSDESGAVVPIDAYGAGYWLWLSSAALLLLPAPRARG